GVQVGRRLDRLVAGGHRGGQCGRDEADPLAYLLMVAIAAQPGQAKTFRREGLDGLVENAGPSRESQRSLKQIRTFFSVRLPEDVARPVRFLNAVIPRRAGVRAHRSTVEEGEEIRQLVALGVVDRVSRQG